MSAPVQGTAFPPYSLTVLNHQTGLSVTPSTANAWVNVGNAVSVPRAGKALISLKVHVSAGTGNVQILLTRGGVTYTYSIANTTCMQGCSGKSNSSTGGMPTPPSVAGFTNTSPAPLMVAPGTTTVNEYTTYYDQVYTASALWNPKDFLELLVLSGDTIQLQATNNTANDTTYIDDYVVILQ